MVERRRTVGAAAVRPGVVALAVLAVSVVLAATAAGLAPGPALAQSPGAGTAPTPTPGARDGVVAIGREKVGLARVQVGLSRRVVPFDGQVRLYQPVAATVTVTLDAQVLFDFDQATLTPTARTSLQALAEELNRTLAAPAVAIDGYTDAVGTDQHNLELSTRRATAVRDFLTPLVRVPVTFTVNGHGSANPLAPNTRPDGGDDPEGRRRNRRVELTYAAKAPA